MTKIKYTNSDLSVAVKNSTSMRGVAIKLGLSPGGGNSLRYMKQRILELGLDTSHFLGQGYLKDRHHTWAIKQSLINILVENSSYTSSNRLRLRLIAEGFFEQKCYSCQLTQWLDRPISLELEHRNGCRSDNRLENLTLLCPNCHAQTSTYRGRNKRSRR